MRVEPSVAKIFAEVLRTLLQTDKAQQTEYCYKNKQKIRLAEVEHEDPTVSKFWLGLCAKVIQRHFLKIPVEAWNIMKFNEHLDERMSGKILLVSSTAR